MRTTLRAIVLTAVLLQLGLAYASPALAQTSGTRPGTGEYRGPEDTIKEFLCIPKDRGGQDLFGCINKLYRVAIAVGSIAGVFFIVYAGYLYMSAAGSQEQVSNAKSYLGSTFIGLMILFSGYLILRTLNPQLVTFPELQLPSTTPGQVIAPSPLGPGGGGGGGTTTPPSTNTQAAAQRLQAGVRGVTINSSRCDCSGNCPSNTIQLVAQGQPPLENPQGCQQARQTTINLTMLNAIIAAGEAGNSFIVESLTGGRHSAGSSHARGNAVDLVPSPATAQSQATLAQKMATSGARVVALECDNPNRIYKIMPSQSPYNDPQCIGKPGYHLHVEF